jgi:hypothetical protein
MGTATPAATATPTTTDPWPTTVQSLRTRKATSPATTATATTRPTTTRPTGASKATAESGSTGGSKPTAM